MSKYKIFKDTVDAVSTTNDVDSWSTNREDRHITFLHDLSQFTLATPDDVIIVVGPPRLHMASDDSFSIVGFANSVNYSESAQVVPLKAIGSTRHIFSKTNQPVQGSIARLVAHGPNLYQALYNQLDIQDLYAKVPNKNTSLANTTGHDSSVKAETTATWFANLEDILYRVPFGLGIIYASPGNYVSNASKITYIGADYLENCVIVNRNVGIQSGQTYIMEQVTFMADRSIAWPAFSNKLDKENFVPTKP